MTLVHYEPFRYDVGQALNQLQRRFQHAFDSQAVADATTVADWIPPADIAEYADRFVLQLDVPGVSIDAIEITLEQGVLTISGERTAQAEAKDVERSRRERLHGRFQRRFTLPETVDAAGVRATGRNGILEVTIPKQAKAQPRRIEVAVA